MVESLHAWLTLERFDRREVDRRLRRYAAGDERWREGPSPEPCLTWRGIGPGRARAQSPLLMSQIPRDVSRLGARRLPFLGSDPRPVVGGFSDDKNRRRAEDEPA